MRSEVNKSSMTSRLAAGTAQVSADAAQPTLLLLQSYIISPVQKMFASDCHSMRA